MKPNEFWDSTYREINIFTTANLTRIMDEFRQEIRLQEAVTDKLILADAMSNRRPRINPLQKTFEKLFPKKEEYVQTPDEITKRMRGIIRNEKKL